MFVLMYRNANGNFRVSPRPYSTLAQASAFAKYYVTRSAEFAGWNVGRLMVVDLTTTIKEAHEAYISLELREAKADGMDDEYLGAYEYHLTHGNIENIHATCGGCVFCMDNNI